MIKALFFGGAFNPPTKAHLELADFARKELGKDKVLFVPSKSHYILKTEGKASSYSEEERLKMLLAIKKDYPWMEVSDIELQSKEQPRTYFTLRALAKEGYDVTLLTGSDWLPGLQSKWLYIDEILKEFGIVVMQRSHDDIEKIFAADPYLLKRRDKLKILYVPEEYQNVSSSEVRRLISEKKMDQVRTLVPQEILPYL